MRHVRCAVREIYVVAGLLFDDGVGWALWHTTDGAHVGAAITLIGIDYVSFISGVGTDRIARAYRTAGIAHDT